MKVNELLMNIHNKEFNLGKRLEVKIYLPIEVKKTIAQSIMFDCVTELDGVVKIDSIERYMSYVRHMITMHTNLEYTDADYDVLCSTEYGDSNLLNEIMDCFGNDAQECSRILTLMIDDYMQEMSIEFAVAKFLNGLGKSINGIVETINSKVSDVNIPEQVDMDKLNTFLSTYIN